MIFFGKHSVFALCILFLLMLACGKPDRRNTVSTEAPILIVEPPSGAYYTGQLQVEVSTESGGELYFGLDTDPVVHPSRSYRENFKVSLTKSTQLYVIVKDEKGRLWGPYVYEYLLGRAPGSTGCNFSARERQYFRNDESITFEVYYGLPTALAMPAYSLDDGPLVLLDREELDESGLMTVTIGPLREEGAHRISCSIESAPGVIQMQDALFYIDGTPPTASWIVGGGIFDRTSWPAAFVLQTDDGLGSGVASAEVCLGEICLSMADGGAGQYEYATALTDGSSIASNLAVRVSDRAGNTASPLTLPISASFNELEPDAPLPIAVTTAATVSLPDLLQAAGRDADDLLIRSLDGTTALPHELPLLAGWNDFLYQSAGRTEWQSFAAYRAGVWVSLPLGGPWLAYASSSTIPGLQAELIDALVPGGVWFRPWFDIPHLWFIRDVDTDGRWSDADEIWRSTEDSFAGPWQARATPVVAEPGFWPFASAASSAVQVSCAVCGNGGTLFFERRASWSQFPVTHASFSAVLPIDLLGTTTVYPAQGDVAGVCLFFWDENQDGALGLGEPRSFSDCLGGAYDLAREGTLAVADVSDQLIISGLPYGGMATGFADIMAGSELLLRRYVGPIFEQSGSGTTQVSAPTLVAYPLPFSLTLFAGEQASSSDLAGENGTGAAYVDVQVEDEAGVPQSAVVLLEYAGGSSTGIYNKSVGPARIYVPTIGTFIKASAVRDGFVSRRINIGGSASATLTLSQTGANSFTGQVVDTLGEPVPHAGVSWASDVYDSRVIAGVDGSFSIPVSGESGRLAVRTGSGDTVTLDLAPGSGGMAPFQIVLTATPAKFWARGLLGNTGTPTITGPAPVTVITQAPYYFADMTTGAWTITAVDGLTRRFSVPGEMPALTWGAAAYWVNINSVAHPSLQGKIVCGDRQRIILPQDYYVLFDSSCWSWFASDVLQTYFLGRLQAADQLVAVERFGLLEIWVSGSASTLVLTDQLLGRTIRVNVAAGRVSAPVPVGVYRVALPGGEALSNADGGVTLRIRPGIQSTYSVTVP